MTEIFLENQIIRGLTYDNIYQMMVAVRINVWEPLGWLMKALVYSICGLDSLSNRIAAFMLHTLNSVLLYELIFWILRTRFWKPHSAAAQQSALAGSIFFAIHPLNVEVIGWPSANPYTLSCTFSLISLLLYTCHVDVNRDREVKLYNYIYVSTIFYFFAVMSKGVALTIPVAILAIDCTLQRRDYMENSQVGRLFKDLLIYCYQRLVYAVAVLVALFATVLANIDGTNPMLDTIKLTTLQRVLKAFHCIMFFSGKIVYPTSLHAHYQVHEWKLDTTKISNDVLVSFAFVSVLTCVFVAKVRQFPGFFAFWVYFLAMMLPVTGIIQHGMIAMGGDRYMYLPMIGVAVVISFIHFNFADDSHEATNENQQRDESLGQTYSPKIPSTSKILKVLVTIVIAILYSVITRRQILTWRNDVTVWEHNIRNDPTDWRALDQLVEFYIKRGNVSLAIPYFDRIEWYSPQNGLKAALHNAKFSILKGKTMEACQRYQRASERFESNAALYNNLGVCALQKDQRAVALEMFSKALEIAEIDREKRTITSNYDTLTENMENRDDSTRYRGQHALIF